MNEYIGLSVKSLFNKAWHAYKTKFALLFGILSAPLVAMVLSYLLAEILQPLSFVLLILAGLLAWASQIALIYALKLSDLTVLEAYKMAVMKIFSLLWTGVLVAGNLISVFAIPLIFGLIILSMQQAGMFEASKTLLYSLSGVGILLGLLGVIFAIYLSITYQFVTYSLIVDDHRGVSALLSSSALVKGKWLLVFSRVLAIVIIFALPVFILSLFMQNQQSLFNLIQSVYGYVIAPFTVAYIYNLFVGLKEHKGAAEEEMSSRNWVVGRAAFGFAVVLGLLLFMSVVQKTDYFPGLKARFGEIQQQSKTLGK